MSELRPGLNEESEITLEIEAPTPVSTPRPGPVAPAKPEGPLELIYPPGTSRVLYCEARKERSNLAKKRSFRTRKKDLSVVRPWKGWPIGLLIALAYFSLIGLH